MRKNSTYKALRQHGVGEEQADLISDAMQLAGQRWQGTSHEITGMRAVRRTFFSSENGGKDFRAYQSKVNAELKQLTPSELAFGDIPDWAREQHAAFCFNMYEGHQARYLDRHEDETVNDYLDRQNKATLNVTRLVINALSKLYHKQPTREFPEDGLPPPPYVRERLQEVWSSKLFNRTMIDVDKFTRLLGTVAIRPMYDPELPGRVRLWVFMSHQLRVIPSETQPWKPSAVIERQHPFGSRDQQRRSSIWTDRYFVCHKGSQVTVTEHRLGKIPHVFVKDQLSWNSFFVEGRGRMLCDPNAVLNNDLSDYEEVKQLQSFSVGQVVNAAEDDLRIGPRQIFKFEVNDRSTPYGIDFKAPNAPLAELRQGVSEQIKQILMVNDVPVAALGAAIDQRQLSGEAIRAAMQPIVSDLEQRERIFEPTEVELADSMLRVVAVHEEGFSYQQAKVALDENGEPCVVYFVPEELRPTFDVKYQPLSFPSSTRDQIMQDDFDISQGMETPPSIMRRRHPDRYDTHEDAVAQWHRNLRETADAGFGTTGDDGELQASYGGETPQAMREQPTEDQQSEDLLGLFERAGLVQR